VPVCGLIGDRLGLIPWLDWPLCPLIRLETLYASYALSRRESLSFLWLPDLTLCEGSGSSVCWAFNPLLVTKLSSPFG
jgi:hypothetical protein